MKKREKYVNKKSAQKEKFNIVQKDECSKISRIAYKTSPFWLWLVAKLGIIALECSCSVSSLHQWGQRHGTVLQNSENGI